jgi:hypothetical protein
MHENNLNGEKSVVRKMDREEFGEVKHWRKRDKTMIDQPTMNVSW